MPTYRIKNWDHFQHYRDRNPPWIKLHYEILSSSDWVILDDTSRVLAVACMLVASRSKGANGEIDGSDSGLAYLKRVAYLNKTPNLKPLILCGFLVPASTCKQMQADAISEAETETETEPPISPKKSPPSLVFPDWLPSEQWEAYLDMRKSIKRPLTDHGIRLAINELSKLRDAGHDPAAILNQSIFHSWQGLFVVKDDGAKLVAPPPDDNPQPSWGRTVTSAEVWFCGCYRNDPTPCKSPDHGKTYDEVMAQ